MYEGWYYWYFIRLGRSRVVLWSKVLNSANDSFGKSSVKTFKILNVKLPYFLLKLSPITFKSKTAPNTTKAAGQ